MRRFLSFALAAVPIAASLQPPASIAAVIDDIAVEQRDHAPRVRLLLTSPVNFIRSYSSVQGRIAYVQLQALAPGNIGGGQFPDEVRRFPKSALVPGFTVRVSLDPRCDPVPHPVCMTIQFDRAIRARVRLGEDRRSLLLDFQSEGEGGPPAARKKP